MFFIISFAVHSLIIVKMLCFLFGFHNYESYWIILLLDKVLDESLLTSERDE